MCLSHDPARGREGHEPAGGCSRCTARGSRLHRLLPHGRARLPPSLFSTPQRSCSCPRPPGRCPGPRVVPWDDVPGWRASPAMSRPLASSARRPPLSTPTTWRAVCAVRAGSTGASSAPRTGRAGVSPTTVPKQRGVSLLQPNLTPSRPPSQLTTGGCPKLPQQRSLLAPCAPSRSAFQRAWPVASVRLARRAGGHVQHLHRPAAEGGLQEEAGAHGPGQGRREIGRGRGRAGAPRRPRPGRRSAVRRVLGRSGRSTPAG